MEERKWLSETQNITFQRLSPRWKPPDPQTKREWWKKDKKNRMQLKCLMWSEQGLVISPNHFLLLWRSQLNLHLYYPAHCHPLLPIASLATGCRHIYTSCTSPATWQLYGCTCTQADEFSKGKVVKICSDLGRRHGTQQTSNVECDDNTDTPNCSSHSFPQVCDCMQLPDS